MDPDEVKVVVYAARNLQPKKGEGVCNANVVFGIGKQKYRTEFVRDNDPTWNEETVIKVTKPAALVFTVMDREDTLGTVLSSSHAPEITGLSPKSGPSSGGTQITVRGCNLGMSKEEITSITVCGCDLYSTLEYHSPAKLVVTTKPWSGSGPVVIETKAGGRGISTLNFTFQDKSSAVPSIDTSKKSKASKAELLTEITKLREEINDLTGENRSMKNYIDRLMIVLMDKFPEVLENLSSSA
ncbi:hypothetical protein ACROYT_G000465 [Oculina patagonica]